jgi:hypothetical protein
MAERSEIPPDDSPFVEWLTASILLASCVALALVQWMAK